MMHNSDVIPFDLPGLLSDIAHVTDVETARKVAAAFGGHRVVIARAPNPDNWLVKAVGMAKAQTIGQMVCEEDSFERVEIPMGSFASRNMKWRRLKRLAEAGATRRHMADVLGLHEKTVQRIKNGKRSTFEAVIAQSDLFETG